MVRAVRTREERLAAYRRVLEARAPDISGERLRSLARDEIRPVRLWTARNRNCPPDALIVLAHDEDSSVRWHALLNAAMPDAGLRYLTELESQESRNQQSPTFVIREIVLAHPNVSEPLAQQLHKIGVTANTTMAWRWTS